MPQGVARFLIVFLHIKYQCLSSGEARLARRIDIENNHNTCAAHTTGEACLAPTIAPKARTLNLRSLTCFLVFSLASARLCRGEARLARNGNALMISV